MSYQIRTTSVGSRKPTGFSVDPYYGYWQWRNAHWARSGLGPTLNTPSRARSGLVRSGQVHILDTCLCCITCFRNQTLITSVIGLIIVYSAHLRSFSTLRRTKTWLRSTQGQERLSSLASMQIEREILSEIKIQDIVSKFAAKAERRLRLH